jgi:hypothetical protein
MHTSTRDKTGPDTRAYLAVFALASVAALGACSSSDPGHLASTQGPVSEGQAELESQGILHAPADLVQQRSAQANAAAGRELQGIVHPPADLMELWRSQANRAAELQFQGILHAPVAK